MNTAIPEIKAAHEHTKAGVFLFNMCAAWTKFLVKHRWLYYTLACTWGLLWTLAGLVVSGVLAVVKLFAEDKIKITFKPYHWIYSISVGPELWGGLEFGLCFLRDHRSRGNLNAHEFGHSFQNCLFGPLFPFLVVIPSAAWYWSREKTPTKKKIPYDSKWFEDAATQCGLYAIKTLNTNELAKIKEA